MRRVADSRIGRLLELTGGARSAVRAVVGRLGRLLQLPGRRRLPVRAVVCAAVLRGVDRIARARPAGVADDDWCRAGGCALTRGRGRRRGRRRRLSVRARGQRRIHGRRRQVWRRIWPLHLRAGLRQRGRDRPGAEQRGVIVRRLLRRDRDDDCGRLRVGRLDGGAMRRQRGRRRRRPRRGRGHKAGRLPRCAHVARLHDGCMVSKGKAGPARRPVARPARWASDGAAAGVRGCWCWARTLPGDPTRKCAGDGEDGGLSGHGPPVGERGSQESAVACWPRRPASENTRLSPGIRSPSNPTPELLCVALLQSSQCLRCSRAARRFDDLRPGPAMVDLSDRA